MKRAATLSLLLALQGLGAACGGGPEPDPDFERHLAKPMALNKIFTDSLTHPTDKSDWKVLFLESSGLLTVTVHFDRIDGGCEVYLKDKYGAHIAKEVQSNNPYLELVRRIEPGRFFVWINSPGEKCDTEYSIEARLEAD